MLAPHSMTDAKYNSWGSGTSYVEWLLEGLDYDEFNITHLIPSLTIQVYAQTLVLLLFFSLLVMITNVGNFNKGDLYQWAHWSSTHAYSLDGFAREHVVPRNPNVMGYPFPPNTRAVSPFFFFFLSSLPFIFLFQSLIVFLSNFNPLFKSIRNWCGWPRISSWRWPTTRGICMVLEERPTWVVVMIMVMVVRKRTQRRPLATNQGRGSTVDYLQS